MRRTLGIIFLLLGIFTLFISLQFVLYSLSDFNITISNINIFFISFSIILIGLFFYWNIMRDSFPERMLYSFLVIFNIGYSYQVANLDLSGYIISEQLNQQELILNLLFKRIDLYEFHLVEINELLAIPAFINIILIVVLIVLPVLRKRIFA